MKKNMGAADRIIRLLIATVFTYLYFSGTVTGLSGIVLVALGAMFVITSFFGYCPLYTIIRIKTCSKRM